MKAIGLAYHDVVEGSPVSHPDIRPGIALYTVTRTRFQDQLRSIRERKAAVDVIRGAWQWENRRPTFLTFDDGALNALCAADELEKNGWRGHFFVTTNWIGRRDFLDRSQIRELHDRGHVIGSHSCSHPARMSHLSPNELHKEWSESCAILSDILSEPVKVASVPDGYYSRQVGQAAAEAGIKVLFTSEATAGVSVVDDCLILGRYFIQSYTPAEAAGALAAGNIWPRSRQNLMWKAKTLVKGMTGESYLAVRRILLSRLLPQPQR
jgi:peptidoglycan/xylan/chitin deacetylase (PgdA/CDA1 family)